MPTDAAVAPADHTLSVIVALLMAAMVAGALAIIAAGLVRRFMAAVEGADAVALPLQRGTVRVVRFVTFVIGLAVLAFPALDIAGVSMPVGLHRGEVAQWATKTGVRIALILLVVFAANRISASIIARAERELSAGAGVDAGERRKRAQTLASSFNRLLSVVLWTTAALVVLRELEVDITPVLTGAGILGLAVGFGAQTLVKDMISGFFLIAEDQVRVGDVVEVNGMSGLVEQINLRTIVLRDMEGIVYIVSNGDIRALANRSKDFAYYVINLGADYGDDTDDVIDAVKAAAETLQKEPAYAASILEPLEVIGVDDFKSSSVTLRFRIKTLPLKQWEVGRELRRRIKKTFDQRGLKIPGDKLAVTISGTT
jgi:small conductance mechanosensitive channel